VDTHELFRGQHQFQRVHALFSDELLLAALKTSRLKSFFVNGIFFIWNNHSVIVILEQLFRFTFTQIIVI
jgi:hypothetical protein